MNQKIRWITQTAIMLAVLVTLQALTKGMGQLVTGSCVNGILAISVLFGGVSCGITVGVMSPLLAFLLGIAPQILTVPGIMLGNTVYVALLHLLAGGTGKKLCQQIGACLMAAIAKFATLYAVVVWLICGVLSETLLKAGMMKPAMLKVLPATFSYLQLITALIGGGVALGLLPVLRKAFQNTHS